MPTNIRAAAANETWAIYRQWLDAAMDSARVGDLAASRKAPRIKGNVAIIPIHGMITQRGSMWDEIFGGTSTQRFEAAFARALNSDRIGGIVLDVDSPGGTVAGVQSAADRVFAARGVKPVLAVANSLMASAAYWIASAADTVIAAPGSDVGSIGVFRMHQDVSGMLEQDGVKVTFIAEPEYKVEGNPFAPLSEEALAFQQQQVHESYAEFNGAVARHRGVTPAHARENFGKGRTFKAPGAKAAGLADRVATLETVLREMGVAAAESTDTIGLAQAWESCEVDPPRLRFKGVERRRLALDKRRDI